MICVKRQFMGFDITAGAQLVGDDWHLRISGGDTPHIGSVTFAWLENDIVLVKSLVRPHHKDHIIGESFAKAIAEVTKCAVAVEAGIHFDHLSRIEIDAVVALTNEMLTDVLKGISLALDT